MPTCLRVLSGLGAKCGHQTDFTVEYEVLLLTIVLLIADMMGCWGRRIQCDECCPCFGQSVDSVHWTAFTVEEQVL